MPKQFILTRPDKLPYLRKGVYSEIVSKTRYATVEDKRVAYFVNTILISGRKGGNGVVVPGIIVSPRYKNEHGAPAIEVEPITDIEFQGKIRKVISKRIGINNPYSFWTP